jgi:hypothetical protein
MELYYTYLVCVKVVRRFFFGFRVKYSDVFVINTICVFIHYLYTQAVKLVVNGNGGDSKV